MAAKRTKFSSVGGVALVLNSWPSNNSHTKENSYFVTLYHMGAVQQFYGNNGDSDPTYHCYNSAVEIAWERFLPELSAAADWYGAYTKQVLHDFATHCTWC